MDYRQLAADLLAQAKAKGATEADLLILEDESFSAQVRLREVDTVKSAQGKRLGLRVCRGRRTATTATSDFSPDSLTRLLDETLAMAGATAEDPCAGLPAPGECAGPLPELELWDGEAAALPVADRIALAARAEAAALDADPRITNSDGAEYGSDQARLLLANSHGFCGEYRRSSVGLSVTPVATGDGQMQRDGWYTVARRPGALEAPDAVGREAARRALRRLGARKVSTRRVPVVFDPDMAAGLLRTLGSAVSGSAIYRDASFLAGKLGEQIASPALTLVDDGRMAGGLGSRPFDGEGVPTRRTVVVREGRLVSYLLDSYTARKLRLASTGNATRGFSQPPTVGTTNFYALPGRHTPEEIIRTVRQGLYVTELIGFGVNLVTGDYSRGAVGLWIENGELTFPVEEVTVAGNLGTMLRQVEMVGSDLAWRGTTAAPTLKIAEMTVAGT
jgi:PmbA protein